jgi:rSAM/selenodomain-associated transferase 2
MKAHAMDDATAATLSIVIPVLDEAAGIGAALAALAPLRRRGAEVIVVDGGSRDRTLDIAAPLADRVLTAPRGRGVQMNAGARAARGRVLLFLHADTRLPLQADTLIREGLARTQRLWGRFDATINGNNVLLAVIAALMNLRSRLTGVATGDQAIFVARDAFERTGGYPDIALMEDIALCTRLKRLGRPLCLRQRVVTSGRRWTRNGIARTIWLMWRLRLLFFLGAEPATLARRYGYAPRD